MLSCFTRHPIILSLRLCISPLEPSKERERYLYSIWAMYDPLRYNRGAIHYNQQYPEFMYANLLDCSIVSVTYGVSLYSVYLCVSVSLHTYHSLFSDAQNYFHFLTYILSRANLKSCTFTTNNSEIYIGSGVQKGEIH